MLTIKYKVSTIIQHAPGRGNSNSIHFSPLAGGPNESESDFVIQPKNPNDMAEFTIGDIVDITVEKVVA